MSRPQAKKLILTTDPGCDVDDQFVIAHLLLSPEFDVLGIVTTHAPNLAANGVQTYDADGKPVAAAQVTADIAHEVMNLLPANVRRPPVFTGSSAALSDSQSPYNNSGVQFLIEQSRAFTSDNRLTVLVIGAATDVASALVIDPTLQDRIEILALAFESWPHGRDPFNVPNDIRAWRAIFASSAPITIADLAVTIKHLSVSTSEAATICGTSPIGLYLGAIVEKWINRLPQLCIDITGRDAWTIWDQSVVAALLGMVETVEYPRPVLNDDTSFTHGMDRGDLTIKWITSIDHAALWADFSSKLNLT